MGARHVGIGFEVTYGTAVAPTVFLECLRETLSDQVNWENIELIRSFEKRDVIELSGKIQGDIEVVMDYQTLGYLLYLFLGVAPDTTGTTPKVHTFPPSTGLATDGRVGVSATIEGRRDGSLSWRFAGCKIVGLALTGAVDALPRVTLSVIGKAETLAGPASASYLAFDVVKPKHITAKFDGGSALPARSFALNCSWPVDEPYVLGSERFGVEPEEDQVLAVAGSLDLYIQNTTEYAKFMSRAAVDVQIICESGGDESATFNLNKTRLTQFNANVEGRSRFRGTVNFDAYFDTTATSLMQVVVENDVATIP